MKREPDITGRGVRAWKITDERPAARAGLGAWLVNCTWAHPAWSWWTVSVVHLRDLEGVQPAVKKYPAAEFEFLVMALDPECIHSLDPDHPVGWKYLSPIDVVHQFHGVTDRVATQICEDAVRAIANGEMSPDQDFRRAWRENLDATVRHYRSLD